MKILIKQVSPENSIDAYNCQPDTPEMIEFKKQSAVFLADKIKSENCWNH